MPTTTNMGWPYPGATDPPDGPGQIGALANAVDTDLYNLRRPAMCVLERTNAQTITDTAVNVIQFGVGTGVWDTLNMHNETTNVGRITCPTGWDGYYHVYAQLGLLGNATGVRELFFRVAGGGQHYFLQRAIEGSTNDRFLTTGGLIFMNAGQWVEACARQYSGGSLNTTSSDDGIHARFSAVWCTSG